MINDDDGERRKSKKDKLNSVHNGQHVRAGLAKMAAREREREGVNVHLSSELIS